MEMFSSLDKFLTFSGLKSGGASKHPDEGVCHFSPLILQMSARSEALLDHNMVWVSTCETAGTKFYLGNGYYLRRN